MAKVNLTGNLSNVGSTEIRGANRSEKEYLAYLREIFYTEDNYAIKQILKNDLLKYMDGADIQRMKLITLDYFIPTFLKKICNVYDTQPLFKTDNGLFQDEKFTALMDEVDMASKLSTNFERMRYNNTAIPQVKFNENLDKIFIDTRLNEDNTIVVPMMDYELEWSIIAYKMEYYSDDEHNCYYVWDRELNEMYYTFLPKSTNLEFNMSKQSGRASGTIEPVGMNEDIFAPEYENGLPFTLYRYKDCYMDFWGNGMDSLVELVRSINILLTISNDDTIQESIRLLILNFNPTGVEGEAGQLKTGLRHPLFVEEGYSDTDPNGKIVSADLYNDDIIKLIESLTDSLSSLHNVDNIIKKNLEQNLSGVSLRLKNEPLLRQWANDINKVRKSDIELIKNVVSVNNYHRPKNQIPMQVFDNFELEYQEPQVVTDVKEEYELERMKWDDRTSSPLLYILRKNPEFTEEEARDYLKKNIADYGDLTTISSEFILKDVDDVRVISNTEQEEE